MGQQQQQHVRAHYTYNTPLHTYFFIALLTSSAGLDSEKNSPGPRSSSDSLAFAFTTVLRDAASFTAGPIPGGEGEREGWKKEKDVEGLDEEVKGGRGVRDIQTKTE